MGRSSNCVLQPTVIIASHVITFFTVYGYDSQTDRPKWTERQNNECCVFLSSSFFSFIIFQNILSQYSFFSLNPPLASTSILICTYPVLCTFVFLFPGHRLDSEKHTTILCILFCPNTLHRIPYHKMQCNHLKHFHFLFLVFSIFPFSTTIYNIFLI